MSGALALVGPSQAATVSTSGGRHRIEVPLRSQDVATIEKLQRSTDQSQQMAWVIHYPPSVLQRKPKQVYQTPAGYPLPRVEVWSFSGGSLFGTDASRICHSSERYPSPPMARRSLSASGAFFLASLPRPAAQASNATRTATMRHLFVMASELPHQATISSQRQLCSIPPAKSPSRGGDGIAHDPWIA